MSAWLRRAIDRAHDEVITIKLGSGGGRRSAQPREAVRLDKIPQNSEQVNLVHI